jgi:hypothetical protein
LIERIRRLHVVMTIEQQGRLAGSVGPIGIDQRVRARLGGIYELRMFESRAIEPGADEFGGAANLACVGRVGADAGDAEEAEEIVHFPYNGIFKKYVSDRTRCLPIYCGSPS